MFKFLFFFITTLLFAQSQELESIKLQLKWKHQFQFAGYYMAKEKGFYKEAGLDVDIVEYSNDIDILKTVVKPLHAGVYGVGYSSLILSKAKGAKIVLLNAISQQSPHILISLKSSGINSIEDFKDKKMMVSKDAIKTASFSAMLRSFNLTYDDIKFVKPTFSIQSLIDKEADISTSYISNEPYELMKRGIEFRVWNPANYGFDFYDDILFTSQKELKKHPQRVKHFQKATLDGWRYAFEHIDESIDIILKKYNTQGRSREALLYEAKEFKKLTYYDKAELGEIEDEKIKRILDIYKVLGLIHHSVSLDGFIYHDDKLGVLTKKEKRYLKEKKLTLCILPDAMPYESLKNGEYNGISADLFHLMQKDFSLDFTPKMTDGFDDALARLKSKECDTLSLSSSLKQKYKSLYFTKPYIESSYVIATRVQTPFIDSLDILEDKKIALLQRDNLAVGLRKEYPTLKFVEFETVKEALQKIQKGVCYAYVGDLISTSYTIQKEFPQELKISGKLKEKFALSMVTRSDEKLLIGVMQKAFKMLDTHQKQKVLNDWISVEYVENKDYKLLYEIAGFLSMLVILITLIYKREKKLKDNLEVKNIVFDAIMDTIENPMFYKDRAGVYQNVNNTFAKDILGMNKEDIEGNTLDQLNSFLSPKEIAFYKEQDKKLYENQSNQVYETLVKLKDGREKYFRIQKNLFYSSDKKVLGYVGFMYDITDIKQRADELEYIASTDPLTKLYNRRYFTQVGESILKLSKRENQSLSILMLDIDNFKLVNDTYGHKVGDDVIVSIAKALKAIGRESDIACRFGGEEFILLLPSTTLEGALTIAQKLRIYIENTQVSIEDHKSINVTVSIGISKVQHQKEVNLEPSIKRADDALYKAKENGKNRVENIE